jgi:hypothetical protein
MCNCDSCVEIGDRLDALGVTAELEPTDLVAGAVVVLSILKENETAPRLVIAAGESTSVIEQAGLLTIAHRILTSGFLPSD